MAATDPGQGSMRDDSTAIPQDEMTSRKLNDATAGGTPANPAGTALKDRALDAAAEGITIADARKPDRPLIYVNQGFERLTGYARESVLGTNCRFLQGTDTDPETVAVIRRAVEEGHECVVELLNYRKDGTPFWNRLSITPITDQAGTVTHFIGVQSDITARKAAEQALGKTNARLEEINRRLRKDLAMAAEIQSSFLPRDPIRIDGLEVAWGTALVRRTCWGHPQCAAPERAAGRVLCHRRERSRRPGGLAFGDAESPAFAQR